MPHASHVSSLRVSSGRLAAFGLGLGLLLAASPLSAQTTPGAAPGGTSSPSAVTAPTPADPAAPAPASPSAAPASPGAAPAGPSATTTEPQVIPAPDANAADNGAQPIDLQARPVAVFSGSAEWDNGYKDLMAAFAKIRGELGKAGLQPAGRPLAVFLQTDDQGFRFDAMIPIAAPPPGKDQLSPDVKISTSPAGKTLKFEHRGAYDDIDSTYEAITAYLDEKGLEAKNLFIEQYLSESQDPDDTNLAVDIYVFIK